MEYSLRAMELWFQHTPGSFLLERERAALAEWFLACSGTHCLQIGGPSDLRFLQSAHFPHKVYLGTEYSSAAAGSRIQTNLEALPLLANSVDMAVLVHMLEFSESPEALLNETYRILAPEGQLILFAFNPWRWGVRRVKHGKRGFPWSGNFYSSGKLKRWLQEAGYSIVSTKTLCFQPIFEGANSNRWSFMERVGATFFPGFGAVIFIVAQKREEGMTAIRAVCKPRRVKIRGGVIEPTTYR